MFYMIELILSKIRTHKKILVIMLVVMHLVIFSIGGIKISKSLQGKEIQSVSTGMIGVGTPQFFYELYGGDIKFTKDEAYTQVNSESSFDGPLAITVSPKGTIFVADTGYSRIQSFNSNGQWIADLGQGKMVYPSGLTYFDEKLYIADPNAKKVFAYGEDGTEVPLLLDNRKLPLKEGKMGQVIRPSAIQVGPDGLFYITDIANQCIITMDAQGNILKSFGRPGTGDGQFQFPNALYVAKDGKIYVSDSNNGRVQIFDKEGKFLTQITGSNGRSGKMTLPRGIAVTEQGMIYVVDVFSHTVRVYDEIGIELKVWGGRGTQNGEFSFPNGLFIDSLGHIYVTDRENNRVQVFGYK